MFAHQTPKYTIEGHAWLRRYMQVVCKLEKALETQMCLGWALQGLVAAIGGVLDQFEEHTDAIHRGAPATEDIEDFLTIVYDCSLPQNQRQSLKDPDTIAIQVASFSGVYTEDDLKSYFNSLAHAAESSEASHPLPLLLAFEEHAFGIIYDHVKRQWGVIDVSIVLNDGKHKKPGIFFSTQVDDVVNYLKQIAIAVYEERQTHLLIQTYCYASLSNTYEISEIIDRWQQSDEYKRIRQVTEAKASFSNTQGLTWLHLAAKEGDEAAVKQLCLSTYADINQIKRSDGERTPLIYAIEHGQVETARALLENHAHVDPRLPNHPSPLNIATCDGHDQIVELLIAHGADVNYQGKKGLTALHYAAINGKLAITSHLLRAGANVSIKQDDGTTALDNAKECDYPDIVNEIERFKSTTLTSPLRRHSHFSPSVTANESTPLQSTIPPIQSVSKSSSYSI